MEKEKRDPCSFLVSKSLCMLVVFSPNSVRMLESTDQKISNTDTFHAVELFCNFAAAGFIVIQKQQPEVFYKKSCSLKFHNIHSKTPVLESLIKKRLQHCLFPVNIAKFLRITTLRTSANSCFCLFQKVGSHSFIHQRNEAF